MNITLACIISIIVLIISLVVHNGFLYPVTICMATVIGTFLGLTILDSQGNVVYLFLLSIVAFILGYIFQVLITKNKNFIGKKINNGKIGRNEVKVIKLFWIIIIGLVIYHFLVGGIPILSQNVEVERFNFTGSGLFGIPGRMYQFGLPFLLILLSIYLECSGDEKIKKLLIISWVVMITSRLITGFKSGLVEVLILYIFTRCISNRPINIINLMGNIKYIVIVLIIGFVGFFLTKSYDSLGIYNLNDFIKYFFERSTVIQAQPAYIVLSGSILYYSKNPFIINDLLYFISKYLKIGNFDNIVFPLDKIVSSQLYGTPLNLDSFIVPVTVSGFPQIYIDLGIWSLFAFFVVGQAYYYLIYKAKSRNINYFRRALFGLGIFFMTEFITKGGLGYLVVNYILLSLLFIFIFKICRFIIKINLNRG